MREKRIITEVSRQNAAADDVHHSAKELVEKIARALVDEPALVSVSEVGGMNTTILEIKVAKSDIGKVIGKKGRTVGALRTLLSAVSAKTKIRTFLEVVE